MPTGTRMTGQLFMGKHIQCNNPTILLALTPNRSHACLGTPRLIGLGRLVGVGASIIDMRGFPSKRVPPETIGGLLRSIATHHDNPPPRLPAGGNTQGRQGVKRGLGTAAERVS